ncbi:MAG: adenylate cyclase, partial [Prevotella sp.]|nr:adenylate cyclase [Prevotella sp.]
MSGMEIERKFLVKKGDAYRRLSYADSHIRQGYIPADGATIR